MLSNHIKADYTHDRGKDETPKDTYPEKCVQSMGSQLQNVIRRYGRCGGGGMEDFNKSKPSKLLSE